MLILVPASEAKAVIEHGAPLDSTALSFPELAPTRDAVLDAMIDASGQPDATRRLRVSERLDETVRRNVGIRDAPAAPAAQLYTGPLYDGLDVAGLNAAARRRAKQWIVVISPLWGALRIDDHVPSYRLSMCSRLPGLGHLPQVWRDALDATLSDAVPRGVIVDCRSGEHLTAWRPTGALAERTVSVRPLRADGRGAASYPAKHVRGRVIRRIVKDVIDPRHPEALADALSVHFDVELHRPERAGRAWELRVIQSDE